MKKFAILALAVLLVAALTVPAAALENEFGGYWRTRFINQGHFNGQDNDAASYRFVDTRTRLYYTAKINDNLKLVNQFEMDAVWGENQNYDRTLFYDAAGNPVFTNSDGQAANTNTTTGNLENQAGLTPSYYGDWGADGVRVEVKRTYADFNLGPVNFTVGTQPFSLFRSFYIDPGVEATGVIARWKVLDNLVLAGSWLKAFEGDTSGSGNNDDVDSYTIGGGFWFSENISIKPAFNWAHSTDIYTYLGNEGEIPVTYTAPADALNRYTFGFDFDADFDTFGLWATAYMQRGTLELDAALGGDQDFKGYLLAGGGNVMLGPVDLHGLVIYTPGDDNPNDGDIDNIVNSPGASYYWSEIMGYGIFDNTASANSPADNIQNLIAANLGVTFKPMDKLSLSADLWYAKLEEDDANNNSKLGTELDLVATYQLVEGLNLDLVGAYLWAGDATYDGPNDANPYELGMRLSLSF